MKRNVVFENTLDTYFEFQPQSPNIVNGPIEQVYAIKLGGLSRVILPGT